MGERGAMPDRGRATPDEAAHRQRFTAKRCRFWYLLMPFSASLALRQPRDRGSLCLGLCKPDTPLLQGQSIASPKWPLMTYALGLPNTAASIASLHVPLQLSIWPPFP